MHLTNTILIAFLVATSATALSLSKRGIDCSGSAVCAIGSNAVVRKLTGYINELSDSTWVNDGVLIACVREPDSTGEDAAICAFMQGTGGAPASSLKALAQDIVDHGCNKCGSVPLFYPSDNNDGDHGTLKFDYAAQGCGHSGLCI